MGCVESVCVVVEKDDESSTVTFVPEEDRPSFGELETKKYKYSLETDSDIYDFQADLKSRRSLQHLTSSNRNSKSTQPSLIVPFILNSKENERILLSEKEILSWGDANDGFENLLSSKHGQSIFGAFLQKEFSCENLLFWMDCNKLKEIDDPEEFDEKIENIFKTYIYSSSEEEISLDFKVKEKLMQDKAEASETIFDEAQSKIYSLMKRDSFPRFLASDFYKDLMPKSSLIRPEAKIIDCI